MGIDYFAQHGPFGAYASFTLGRLHRSGGFGLELGRPADQEVYVAFGREGERSRALPFFEGFLPEPDEAFGTETGGGVPTGFTSWDLFTPEAIERRLGWASDTWRAGDLQFRLLTPFGVVSNPSSPATEDLRLAVLPAILAEVELDNTASNRQAWAFVGISRKEAGPLRRLSESTGGRLVGIADETKYGLAAIPEAGRVEEVLTWDIPSVVRTGVGGPNRWVGQGGLLLRVGPGERGVFTLALGFFRDGIVTSGIASRYYYTRFYPRLEDVLQTALEHRSGLKAVCEERDRELRESGLSEDRQFLLAHATHSYYANTQLLEAGGEPLWVVNEGEYQWMNTFDLAADQLFFELRFHPWAVRNILDMYASRYRYHDEVQDVRSGRTRHPGGLSFPHDIGIANQFMPPEWGSYEEPDQPGCFSFMTHEQLVNWILCTCTYGLTQGDDVWLHAQDEVLTGCLESLLNRDHHESTQRDGVMSYDSTRCGSGGQEITTYDSLDPSLGQARGNLYLAVKTWAAYVGLGTVLDRIGRVAEAEVARRQARSAAGTIAGRFDPQKGFIPAVFDENVESRVIPAVEGLAFPAVWGDREVLSPDGPYGDLVNVLGAHLRTVLSPGVCIDAESGGWKISSTSTNTWMSKIAMCQFVAEDVLGFEFEDAREWDRAHVRWQQEGCADWAFTDQVRSTDGAPLGSRYYPRGVSAILWLHTPIDQAVRD